MDFNNIEVSQTIGKLKELFDNQNTMIGYFCEHRFNDPHQDFDNAKAGHKNFYYELISAMEMYRGIEANPMAEQQFLNWHNNYELQEIQRSAQDFSPKEQMTGHALFVSASFHVPTNFKKPTVELIFRELIFKDKGVSEKIAYPYQITTFVVAKYIV